MCYHSKQTKQSKTLEKRFKASLKDGESAEAVTSKHFNGFDFPKTPIITNQDIDTIQLFHWGLIPEWANDHSIRQHTLNARIETLDEKPSFQHHATHRCLVLADGFYEWQWLDSKGKEKQKYALELTNEALFAFAGIWSEWYDTAHNNSVFTYTIVTTEAKGIMREVHNSKLRMPVILSQDQEMDWLEGGALDAYKELNVELRAKTENLQGSLF